MTIKRPRPISRPELLNLAVTGADAFTALRFLRHRENYPAVPELEERGASRFPGIEGSLLDLYESLWNPEPAIKEEVSADRKYWQAMLGETLKSSVYAELHAATQLRELLSVLGTVSMGESLVALVSKEDGKKMQQLQQAQQQANQAAQDEQQAEANADAAQQLADAAQQQAAQAQGQGDGQSSDQSSSAEASADHGQSDDQPQPGQGTSSKVSQSSGQSQSGSLSGGQGKLTPEEARAIADQLAEAATEAKAQASAAQRQAQQAQAVAGQLAEQLMGKPGTPEAQKKLDELRRIGQQAVRDAQAKVQEVSSTIEAWGLEEGELVRKSIPEVMGLLERMKRSSALKKFAGLLGRIRKIAAKKAKSKISGEGARVTTVETGRDLKRAHRSEIVALLNPALRVKALTRWTRGELRLHGQKTKQKLGHGPVIVCEDGSGSMEGVKQQWAKAVVLSLAHYAKLQHRDFAWIHFGAAYTNLEVVVCKGGKISGQQMLTVAETFRNASGTDFEKPLNEALRIMREAGLPKADIALITDGECAVSKKFLENFRAAKKALEFNVVSVLCDVGSSTDKTVREFSDRVEKVSAFTAEEAENKIFGCL